MASSLLTKRDQVVHIPTSPDRPRRLPVGPDAQLEMLRSRLEWCDRSVRRAQSDARVAMTDPDLGESGRWDAVRALRAMAWKVCREILPLLSRVPAELQTRDAYIECQRVGHQLRRSTESALADNANYTVDLMSKDALLGRSY